MKKLLLQLDPGHGTRAFTKGKRSPDERIFEGEWNRDFALKLQERIEKELDNVRVHILVTEEKDISLSNRVLRSNTITNNFKRLGYDNLLVSIHLNAAPVSGWNYARGLTVHCSENASTKSKTFAKLLNALAKEYNLTGNRWQSPDGYLTDNFYIIKNTSCPAVLVEHAFMTNKDDVEFLLSDEGCEKLCDLYIETLKSYILYIQSK